MAHINKREFFKIIWTYCRIEDSKETRDVKAVDILIENSITYIGRIKHRSVLACLGKNVTRSCSFEFFAGCHLGIAEGGNRFGDWHITILLRNNLRTKGVPFVPDKKMSREKGRTSLPFHEICFHGGALLAQFINGRIHRPSGEQCTRQSRKIVENSKVSPLASLEDAIISPSSTVIPCHAVKRAAQFCRFSYHLSCFLFFLGKTGFDMKVHCLKTLNSICIYCYTLLICQAIYVCGNIIVKCRIIIFLILWWDIIL